MFIEVDLTLQDGLYAMIGGRGRGRNPSERFHSL